MKRYIHIKFSNGEIYQIPAEIVASNRAKYYAALDHKRGDIVDYETGYADEYAYGLGDEAELLDWLKNNMNWSDVSDHAKLTNTRKSIDYAKEFTNAPAEVIDDDSPTN